LIYLLNTTSKPRLSYLLQNKYVSQMPWIWKHLLARVMCCLIKLLGNKN